MTKLTAPLFSISAVGVLGKDLQLQTWRGRSVAGRRRRPKQPRTMAQRATRLWMTWFSTQWKQLSDAELLSWKIPAPEHDLPAYNAFIKYNLAACSHQDNSITGLLDHDFFPSTAWPKTRDTEPGIIFHSGLNMLAGGIRHEIIVAEPEDGWCVAWYYTTISSTGIKYDQLIHIAPVPAAGTHAFDIYNLPAGSAYVTFGPISRTGLTKPNFAQRSITPLPP